GGGAGRRCALRPGGAAGQLGRERARRVLPPLPRGRAGRDARPLLAPPRGDPPPRRSRRPARRGARRLRRPRRRLPGRPDRVGRGGALMRKLIVLVVLAAAAVVAVRASERLPDAPEPIAWDREACAHCHMHVGEPGFAAQASDADGRVYTFDDPGCLLDWRAHRAEPPARIWFHHSTEDRWIPLERVAFLRGARSPMGSGLAAVDRGTPGALLPGEVRP